MKYGEIIRNLWADVHFILCVPFWIARSLLVMLLLLLFVLISPLLFILSLIIFAILKPFQDRTFRRRMIETGRYLTLEQLEKKLEQGAGTLLLVGLRRPAWWTADDIIAEIPLDVPIDEKSEQSEELKEFAEACDTKYTDYQNGIGLFVDVPYTYPNQDLEGKFPNAKILTILTSYRGYEIVQGDFHRTEQTPLDEEPLV